MCPRKRIRCAPVFPLPVHFARVAGNIHIPTVLRSYADGMYSHVVVFEARIVDGMTVS